MTKKLWFSVRTKSRSIFFLLFCIVGCSIRGKGAGCYERIKKHLVSSGLFALCLFFFDCHFLKRWKKRLCVSMSNSWILRPFCFYCIQITAKFDTVKGNISCPLYTCAFLRLVFISLRKWRKKLHFLGSAGFCSFFDHSFERILEQFGGLIFFIKYWTEDWISLELTCRKNREIFNN